MNWKTSRARAVLNIASAGGSLESGRVRLMRALCYTLWHGSSLTVRPDGRLNLADFSDAPGSVLFLEFVVSLVVSPVSDSRQEIWASLKASARLQSSCRAFAVAS